ncbi:TniQ family protein [Mycobacterium porcinum]|uniref:TniQ family protein n=2 Tax=Mycolicibacterium porcinum TaxID=39693 RepID=A0AAW5T107_9MYCO|nr:TniQ family protein [Mycolicibacterium porcinum]
MQQLVRRCRVSAPANLIMTHPREVRPGTTGRLPARVRLRDGEALDGFLERLATVNDLLPTELLRLLTAPDEAGSPTAAFLMVKPDPLIVERIARLGDVDEESVRRASLLRFGAGLPFQLENLDPSRRHTYRQVVGQGWFPGLGTQACPMCLGDCGVWELHWRLPIIAACSAHQVFMVTECTACGGRFRTHRRMPLRAFVGREQLCGNSVGSGNCCEYSVLSHKTDDCPPTVLESAQVIQEALSGQQVPMLGALTDPGTYLAEIRHLATLLIHLLAQPRGAGFAPWAEVLHAESAQRAAARGGPRWGFRPPQSAVVRGHALAEAHVILSQTSLGSAVAFLVPWLDCNADQPGGPCTWLLNRSTRTATMERLIRAAVANKHHVGRRLTVVHGSRALTTSSIPQMLDARIFRDIFAPMLGGYERTGRMYASLCIVRAISPVQSWSAAAAMIGMEPEVGVRTARAASGRMRVSPEEFAAAVHRATYLLFPGRDFRRREAVVRALAQDPGTWWENWRTSMSPSRRPTSLPYAIAWMWCEVAQAPEVGPS